MVENKNFQEIDVAMCKTEAQSAGEFHLGWPLCGGADRLMYRWRGQGIVNFTVETYHHSNPPFDVAYVELPEQLLEASFQIRVLLQNVLENPGDLESITRKMVMFRDALVQINNGQDLKKDDDLVC